MRPYRGAEDIVIANIKNSTPSANRTRGFSVIELLIVVTIIMVVAGIAIPNFVALAHSARLKGAVTDFASILNKGRRSTLRSCSPLAISSVEAGSLLTCRNRNMLSGLK